MNVYFGNLSTTRMASEMGIELSDEDIKTLDDMRQDDAQKILPGRFHCFDGPRVIVCGDMDTCLKVNAVLQKYKVKGLWQIAMAQSAAPSAN